MTVLGAKEQMPSDARTTSDQHSDDLTAGDTAESHQRKLQVPRIYFIGVDGEKAVDSQTTRSQIEAVKELECALTYEGDLLDWEVLDDPDEKNMIFRTVERDRKRRVDEQKSMPDRAAFAVIYAIENVAVRMEFYEGSDELEQLYDARCEELEGKDLANFQDYDPQAHDGASVFGEAFGLPPDLAQSILDKWNKTSEQESGISSD